MAFSWQKVLGGEGGHGMLVLGPRAVERLERHVPEWPLPKLFRLTAGGKLNEGIFAGETINTPSMLCVEDVLDALAWAESVGGLDGLVARTRANGAVIADWVEATPWVDHLAAAPETRSPTSVCLGFTEAWFAELPADERAAVPRRIAALLAGENIAFDVAGHREAPPGLRIWAGATIDREDLEALMPWLDWAYGEVKASYSGAA